MNEIIFNDFEYQRSNFKYLKASAVNVVHDVELMVHDGRHKFVDNDVDADDGGFLDRDEVIQDD